MTETVAPEMTALFGSVIRPVSDASADCAWSTPRSNKPSIAPRTNLRMDTPVHFRHVVRHHPEILPQPSLPGKGNRSNSPNGLIRQIGQICTSLGHVFLKGSKKLFVWKTICNLMYASWHTWRKLSSESSVDVQ